MKKLFMIGLVVAFVLSFASFTLAEEVDAVVGEDIEIGEGEFKIVSLPVGDEDEAVSDEDIVYYDDPDAVVGEDIDIDEGEFRIISMPEDPDEDAVVGDDIAIDSDEAKIISVDDAVVGDDIEIGDDEAKIISVDNEDEDKSNWPLAAGVSLGVLAVAGLLVLLKKVL